MLVIRNKISAILDAQMKENRSLITMGLKPFLVDDTATVRVKMSLCQLCVALADNEYVQADGEGWKGGGGLENRIFR